MRQQFSEYYSPSDDEYEKFLKEGIISLDANVLLNPYRVDKEARTQVFAVLDNLKERLWVPYQASLEFFTNRPSVMAGEESVYQKLESPLLSARSKIEEHLKTLKYHPVVSAEVHREMLGGIDALLAKVNHLSRERDAKLEDALRNDTILSKWESLLEGRVGERPDDAKSAALLEDAEKRLSKSLPPGYRDAEKDENSAGDAVLWLQLLEHAQTTKRRLILITDDTKDDWYRRHGGKTIGPRVELVREMREKAGVPYYQQTLAAFIRRAGALLHTPISQKTVEQVRSSSINVVAQHYESIVSSALIDLHLNGGAASIKRSGDDGFDFVIRVGRQRVGISIIFRRIAVGVREIRATLGAAVSTNVDSVIVISNTVPSPAGKEILARGFAHGVQRGIRWIQWTPEDPVEELTMNLQSLLFSIPETSNSIWK
ncbi:PIN domain-containing protein [Streptomyces parvulus]|uniref:PIN domain-containing protein n=1 Tax=Streptomyces parvulus TaxID=146923 RepID=UPI001CFBF4F3|nr:PIN domain-containing protein [Streptomyces parvulus]